MALDACFSSRGGGDRGRLCCLGIQGDKACVGFFVARACNCNGIMRSFGRSGVLAFDADDGGDTNVRLGDCSSRCLWAGVCSRVCVMMLVLLNVNTSLGVLTDDGNSKRGCLGVTDDGVVGASVLDGALSMNNMLAKGLASRLASTTAQRPRVSACSLCRTSESQGAGSSRQRTVCPWL
jgi:hypothetical protein